MRRRPLGRVSPPLCSRVLANGIQPAHVWLKVDIEPDVLTKIGNRVAQENRGLQITRYCAISIGDNSAQLTPH